tara:strand:+ start:338 stop:619 length:282 start_codon:yes stop_codon:yes gene_type:complete
MRTLLLAYLRKLNVVSVQKLYNKTTSKTHILATKQDGTQFRMPIAEHSIDEELKSLFIVTVEDRDNPGQTVTIATKNEGSEHQVVEELQLETA